MKYNDPNDLLENHLQILNELEADQTDDFFYTRLNARMERDFQKINSRTKIRSIQTISFLAILLILNFMVLISQLKNNSIQNMNDFAHNFNVTIESPF